jgi:heme oxygenase
MTDTTSDVRTTAMARLRAETKGDHLAVERTALSRALLSGAITLTQYRAQLRAFHGMLSALEGRLASSEDPRVRGVYTSSMARAPALDADLEALAAANAAGDATSDAPARELPPVNDYRDRILRACLDGPGLLGHLYVFEGSRLGAETLLPRLTSALGVTPAMTSYYRGHAGETMERWRAFGDRMNHALAAPVDQDACVAAARDTFRRIADAFEAIAPSSTVSPSAEARRP